VTYLATTFYVYPRFHFSVTYEVHVLTLRVCCTYVSRWN